MNVGRMMTTFLDSDKLMTFSLIIADRKMDLLSLTRQQVEDHVKGKNTKKDVVLFKVYHDIKRCVKEQNSKRKTKETKLRAELIVHISKNDPVLIPFLR